VPDPWIFSHTQPNRLGILMGSWAVSSHEIKSFAAWRFGVAKVYTNLGFILPDGQDMFKNPILPGSSLLP